LSLPNTLELSEPQGGRMGARIYIYVKKEKEKEKERETSFRKA
jgi:hypothetical protein